MLRKCTISCFSVNYLLKTISMPNFFSATFMESWWIWLITISVIFHLKWPEREKKIPLLNWGSILVSDSVYWYIIHILSTCEVTQWKTGYYNKHIQVISFQWSTTNQLINMEIKMRDLANDATSWHFKGHTPFFSTRESPVGAAFEEEGMCPLKCQATTSFVKYFVLIGFVRN